ncbi:MAG TPA: prefoldin subunit beta [Candidatus Nanoarchaeia archaeon]|nr:prefoldin subunit beta [Candidatus Nanoarchaeia archaeon]
MAADKNDLQERMQELQILQQRLSLFTAQKQQLQLQLAEIENAMRELETAKPPAYKLIGEILVENSIDDLKKDLKEKKDEADLRIKTLEKQESKSRERAQDLQKEVTKALKAE